MRSRKFVNHKTHLSYKESSMSCRGYFACRISFGIFCKIEKDSFPMRCGVTCTEVLLNHSSSTSTFLDHGTRRAIATISLPNIHSRSSNPCVFPTFQIHLKSFVPSERKLSAQPRPAIVIVTFKLASKRQKINDYLKNIRIFLRKKAKKKQTDNN